jgi:hypothetical protein
LAEWIETANAGLAPDNSDLPWADPDPGVEGEPLSDEELAAQETLEVGK